MKKIKVDKIKKLDLHVFEEKLKTMAMDGDLGDSLEDIKPSSLSSDKLNQVFQSVKNASIENRILKARKKLPSTRLPFGRHVQWIRNKSGVSKQDVAKNLQKDVSFVDKIEDGRINPISLLINELVDLMQFYRISVSELVATIAALAKLGGAKIGKMSAMARSSLSSNRDKKTEALDHAFDAVLHEIAKSEEADKKGFVIDEKYVAKLKKELVIRGEKSLLK